MQGKIHGMGLKFRVPSGHQLDWLKSAVARAIVCATRVWWFQELGVLEGGQERKSPVALSGLLKQPEIVYPQSF